MKLLVAIDFSTVTDKVIAQAEKLSRLTAAHVWIIHVAAPEPDFIGYDDDMQPHRDALAEEFRQHHRDLQSLADQLRIDGVEATALLVQGPTVETLLHEAEKLNVDMIIAGSHGRGAIANMLIGSACEGLLRGASCPVLIVPKCQ